MNLKFGTDGIRGPVENKITPEACLKIGHATGLVMKELGWEPKWTVKKFLDENGYEHKLQ